MAGGSADARKIITLYDERTVTLDGVRIDVIPAWRFFVEAESAEKA
ncbi:MAG: hypothetical protein WCK89_00285 [bacterium]